uniref:RING-type domain-containing protein n=1 Tax=Caenorhabditis tropicalis TaxID=1561998 RepID=A0A1I7TK65_9PELO
MDPFDDELNNFNIEAQLNRLNQLEDELRAEIGMEIELDVVPFADQLIMDVINAAVPERNVIDPQENLNQEENQAVGVIQIQRAGELDNRDPEIQEDIGQDANAPGVGNRGDGGEGPVPVESNKEGESEGAEKAENDFDDPILTPNGSEMKGLACMICYDSFNTGKRIPKVFPCGHSFCLSCVKGLMKNRSFLSSSSVICPTCRQNTRYSTSLGADKVPTNFCILAMLEQRKEEKIPNDKSEMLECKECHLLMNGAETTICNESGCQDVVDEELLKEIDSIKRPKIILICRDCIKTNHSRHNFVPFNKVNAQYEANRKISIAEAALDKGLKAADEALVSLKLAEREVLDHRKRMANALVNIRGESDHPHIYEYLNRYMTSVEASSDLFKEFTGDMAAFDFRSKARYYRSFGNDMLRPISISQRDHQQLVRPKEEPRDEVGNQPPRDRAQQPLNRAPNRLARFNVFAGPLHGRNFFLNNEIGNNQPGRAPPNIDNMLGRVLDQLEAGHGLRDLPAIPFVVPVAGGEPVADAPGLAELGAPRDARNRLDMWAAVRGPLAPRRFRRNEAREIRAIRQNLIAAMAANPVLEGIPAIQQAIDGLRDNREVDEGFLGRRHAQPMDNDQFGRELIRAEEQLNRLRDRLNRLEGANPRGVERVQNREQADVPPVPWVDRIVEEPLARLPPIDGIAEEVIHRAEINELITRVRDMVKNEAEADAAANGQPVPQHIEMPPLLNPEAVPGVPDFNNLLPVQVAPFLAELRALELEWIQRGRDRRARAANAAQEQQPPVAEPNFGEQIELPRNEEPAVQQNRMPVENDDGEVDDLPRREHTPVLEEPAAKRVRQ